MSAGPLSGPGLAQDGMRPVSLARGKHLGDSLRERRGERAEEQHMLSAQEEGLSALCIEVYVNDRGAFLFAEHDERDSLGRPYGEGYGLVEEVVVVRNFFLQVVR
jgi:hypothetical protein